MDDKLRLKLVQLATEGYPKFRASDFVIPSASAFLYCSYVGRTETDLSPTHFPSCHWFGQLEAVPPLVRVGTHYCRKSSSGLSPSRLSGRDCLFTAECADCFFSGIRNQLHFYPSGHGGGKRRTLLPASGSVR